MNQANTLPLLLARNASRWPRRPAWRHKRLGIWETQSWAAFAQRCDAIAQGLAASGFAAGDRLAVLGDNRPDLYAALLAAQSLGGVGVPLDPDIDSPRLAAIMEDAGIGIAIADCVDQADRLHTLPLPSPVRVFCADSGGFNRHDVWEKASLDVLVGAGRTTPHLAAQSPPPSPLPQGEREFAGPAGQDLALLLYPADGRSHPLHLSHAQLIAAAEEIAAADPAHHTDEAYCTLPMSCYEDALYSLTLGLLCGFACNCPESPDSALRDLREIGPTILFAPPAACNALARVVTSKAEAVSGFKRLCFNVFHRLALRAEICREQDRAVPAGVAIGCRAGEVVTYAPARDQLGLSRARWVHTDGAVPGDTARLLRALGIALRPATVRAVQPGPAREAPETLHA